MKTIQITLLKSINSAMLLLSAMLLPFISNSQEITISKVSSTELSKAARDGRYGGTVLNDGKATVFYVASTKKEGVQVQQFQFNNALDFDAVSDRFVDDGEASKEFAWYLPKEKVEKIASPGDKYILCGRVQMGAGMKFWLGSMVKNYYLGVYTDMKFQEESELKAKTGDIWRVVPSGYKSTSKFNAMSTDAGFYQDLKKYGNPLLAKADAPVLAAGIITEKVSIKDPPPHNSNRVAILAIDAKNFDNSKYNIYNLPYSAITMGSGLGQNDDLCAVFAPLNAPSTVAAHKPLLWKDRKDVFTFMRFNDNYTLVDSVSYRSKLMWGTFDVYNGGQSSYVVGIGKTDFDGWARTLQVKNIDGISITAIKDGKVLYNQLFTEEMLTAKMKAPKGEKVKFNADVYNNKISEVIALPNGDSFFLGRSNMNTYGLQVNAGGELKAYYQLGRINDKESGQYNYQIMFKGDMMYLVMNEQPIEFTNEAQINTSSSSHSNFSTGITTRTTTTTVTRLLEVFLQSQVVGINTATNQMTNLLVLDGKQFYTMGSFPAQFTEKAIYFTGRKGPKGKEVFLARIDI